ncbi:MAG: PAS domain S-box protein, partial [Bacteroidales bacterium]|nr:PAS domain S-box protein [Bacteroidales bacterium]
MASYKNKSKPQLINEIESLQKRVNELEESETEFFWAKKKLKKQEEQLRAVLDNATIHIWAFDGEWYHYLSKEWYRYTGQDPALPLTIERWTEVVHPDDMDEAVKTWFKAWEKKSIYNGYYRIRSAKGKYRLFHSHAVPVYDEKGNLLHYQGYNIDITERKQAEEEIKETKDRYQHLVDNSPDLIAEVNKKMDVISINFPMAKSLGKDVKDIIGMNASEIFNEKIFQERLKIINKSLSENHIIKFEDGRNGRFFENVFVPSLKRQTVQLIIHDITERKQAEEALQESEQKLRDLANLLPQIVYEADINGNLTFINKQAFESFGYSQGEYEKGINLMQTLIPEDRDRAKENIQNILQGKSVGKPGYTALRKDGSTFPILIYSNAILKNNKPVGLRGIVVDITERKHAEDELKAKSLFLEGLIQQSPLPTFVMDSKGFNVMVNEAFLKFYAVPEKEMIIGKNALTEPANVKQGVVTYFKEALKGKIVEIPEMEFVSPYKNKKVITQCRLFPILNPAGTLTNVVVMQEDITERKQAEERLHESEEKYRNLTENMFDIVYSMDTNGILTYISPQTKRYGIDPEKLISKNLLEIIHPEDREKLGMEFRRSLETGEEFP